MNEPSLTPRPGQGHNAARRAKAHALLDAHLDRYETNFYFGKVTVSIPIQNGVFAHVEDEAKQVHK